MDLNRDIGWWNVECIDSLQDTDQLRALVKR
jgi:hypothetical protein